MLTCPVCGASKWIEGASVYGGELTGSVSVSGMRRNKWGDRMAESAQSAVQARICGECGYIALFAEKPAHLWETFGKLER